MAVYYACDGCGSQLRSGDMQSLGLVRKRDYCGECAPFVLRFLAARDELHTAVAVNWRTGLELLKGDLQARREIAKLPDE